MNNEYCIIFHYGEDVRCLAVCIKTLRQVSDCHIVIITDKANLSICQHFQRLYNVKWILIDPLIVENRMMGCKAESCSTYCSGLLDGSKVLVADTDLYFLKDPFEAFNEYPDMDLGIPLRPYKCWTPVSGGTTYFKICKGVRDYLHFTKGQISNMTWPKLLEIRKKYNHTDLNWWIDLDLLYATCIDCVEMEQRFGIQIVGVDSKYNYCPGTEHYGFLEAAQMIMNAYEKQSVNTLHLKGHLKGLVTEGILK